MKISCSSLLSSLPLIILGMGRVLSTKGVNYQEHVTEYGVHWNFFFTVSAVKVMNQKMAEFILFGSFSSHHSKYQRIFAVYIVIHDNLNFLFVDLLQSFADFPW